MKYFCRLCGEFPNPRGQCLCSHREYKGDWVYPDGSKPNVESKRSRGEEIEVVTEGFIKKGGQNIRSNDWRPKAPGGSNVSKGQ